MKNVSLKGIFACIGVVFGLIMMGSEPFGWINLLGLIMFSTISGVIILKNKNNDKD